MKNLTPWAVLLVKPTDDDAAVRRAYHALARTQHSDATGSGEPGPRWFAVTEAYGLVKTEALRTAWLAAQARLARLCAECGGLGVRWRRTGRDRSVERCVECDGEGRNGGRT